MHPLGCCCNNCCTSCGHSGVPTLQDGISMNDIIAAFKDPDRRLNFPIKPFEYQLSFTPAAGFVLLGSATILAVAMIHLARSNKRKS